jgi:hypothetical protein
LPITFDGAVGRARCYSLVPGLAAEPEKNPKALETGDPSLNVINFVEKSFKYTRRNQYMSTLFWSAISVFTVLVTFSLIGYFVARNQVAKAAEAKRIADEQTRRAEAATAMADKKTKEAEVVLT